MELKLWLSFLMICGVPEVQSAIKDWTINVPSKIPALQGSCVVIPCYYTRPKTKLILNRWLGFWMRGATIVSSIPKVKLRPEFKKRTQIMGNLGYGNCTMRLLSVRTTDVGPFYFKIEIPQMRKGFSFQKNKVTIAVSKTPQPPTITLEVLDKVKATCTVYHTCPTSPPRFSWSRSARQKIKSKRSKGFMWETKSTIMFVPLPSDFIQPLNCTVVYRRGKSAQSSAYLSRIQPRFNYTV